MYAICAFVQLATCLFGKQSRRQRRRAKVLRVLVIVTLLSATTFHHPVVIRGPGILEPFDGATSTGRRAHVLVFEREAKVTDVLVQELERVVAGQILLATDTEGTDQKIAKVKVGIRVSSALVANLLALGRQQKLSFAAELRELGEQTNVATEDVRLANERRIQEVRSTLAAWEAAVAQLGRVESLVQTNASHQAEFDRTKARAEATSAALKVAELPVNDRTLGVLSARQVTREVQQQAELRRFAGELIAECGKQASLRQELRGLNAELDRACVTAVQDGVVTEVHAAVGSWARPGEVAVTVVPDGLQFVTEVESAVIAQVRAGMPATVTLDSHDYRRRRKLDGRVRYVSRKCHWMEDGLGGRAFFKVVVDVTEQYGDAAETPPPYRTGEVKITTSRQSCFESGLNWVLSIVLQ